MASSMITYIERLQPATHIEFSELVLIYCLLECCDSEGVCDISKLQGVFNAVSLRLSTQKKVGKFRLSVERLAGISFINVKYSHNLRIIQIVHYSDTYAAMLGEIISPKLNFAESATA